MKKDEAKKRIEWLESGTYHLSNGEYARPTYTMYKNERRNSSRHGEYGILVEHHYYEGAMHIPFEIIEEVEA